MKTTYKQIIEAKGGLAKLLDKQLKPSEAIALARLVKKLNAELELFGEQQKKIVLDKGKDTEKRLAELLAVAVDIDSDKAVLTVNEIDAGTILATEPFVEIKEAGA